MDGNGTASGLTLEQKAYLVSGGDFWRTRAVEKLGIGSMMLIDGPHGLRKQVDKSDHLGLNKSSDAICFPTACALASSFDISLLETVGSRIGEEALAENISIVLGPGNNIKRSPLCGRNFEYFSEDPYLAGKLAAAHIRGVQSRGIGCSLKHFAVNNQERWRLVVNAVVDERTLREIYLAAFEIPVKEAAPMTVMCSYNRVNGTYMSENSYFLNDILRNEWGFTGFVVSDWGAVDELHRSLANGLDLEMPGSGDIGPSKVIKAVKKGSLTPEILDRAVDRIITVAKRMQNLERPQTAYDREMHHNYAYEAAKECIVLLKNDGPLLPLDPETKQTIAVIGEFAVSPRFQGGGSSHINPSRVDTLLDAVRKTAPEADIRYAKGFSIEHDSIERKLADEAIEAVKACSIVIINAGLTEDYETEGMDRTHMNMPVNQLALIDEISRIHGNVVVVLSNGSPVKMPFEPDVSAIVEGWLPGQAGAKAVADILFGLHNPSGKLAESFIRNEKDDPAYGNMPGAGMETVYKEGIYIGYRYHERKKTDLLYPFGHGLSYTTFEYSNIQADSESFTDNDRITVSVDITNTGSTAGKEVVQLYIHEQNPAVDRPYKELKGFAKTDPAPGETKTVTFELDKRSFAYYHTGIRDWAVHSGLFDILIGKSSQNICLRKTVKITSSNDPAPPSDEKVYFNRFEPRSDGSITRNTLIEQLRDHPVGKVVYRSAEKHALSMFGSAAQAKKIKKEKEIFGGEESGTSDFKASAIVRMIIESPLRHMVNMSAGKQMSEKGLKRLIRLLNASRKEKLLGKIMNLIIR